MPLSDLWSWLGGSGGGSTAMATNPAQNYADVQAAMNPAMMGSAAATNAMPQQDYASMAAAMNPALMGQAATTNAVPQSGQTRQAAGGDALAGAIKSLNAQAGQAQGQQTPYWQRAQAPGATSSPIGRPSHGVDINSLLNQLNQWRGAYLAPSAINPQSAAPSTQQRQPGLLGM